MRAEEPRNGLLRPDCGLVALHLAVAIGLLSVGLLALALLVLLGRLAASAATVKNSFLTLLMTSLSVG